MSKSNLYSLPSFHHSMVTVNGLEFAYSGQTVLSIPHWQLMTGEQVFISGESGSGKTTLVSLLSGLIRPDRGTIVINGENLTTMKARQLNTFRADHIGLIAQQFNLIPYLSVMDNILLAHSFCTNPHADMRAEAVRLLQRLGIDSTLFEKKAFRLSVGQQQRVAIVRALINRPKLLIADEPTSALDPSASERFMHLLQEVTREINLSLLFISHDPSLRPWFHREMTLSDLQAHAV